MKTRRFKTVNCPDCGAEHIAQSSRKCCEDCRIAKRQAWAKAYYWRNHADILERGKRWRDANREAVRENGRKSYYRQRDKRMTRKMLEAVKR